MKTPKNIGEIIEHYLTSNNYDGLFNPDYECGCDLDYLAPCGEIQICCKPGYSIPDKSGKWNFIITPKKPKK